MSTIWKLDTGTKLPQAVPGAIDEDAVLNTGPGTPWRVVVGGEGMRKVSMIVRATSARRAAQWAIAFTRYRWLNRKATGKDRLDLRKVWLD